MAAIFAFRTGWLAFCFFSFSSEFRALCDALRVLWKLCSEFSHLWCVAIIGHGWRRGVWACCWTSDTRLWVEKRGRGKVYAIIYIEWVGGGRWTRALWKLLVIILCCRIKSSQKLFWAQQQWRWRWWWYPDGHRNRRCRWRGKRAGPGSHKVVYLCGWLLGYIIGHWRNWKTERLKQGRISWEWTLGFREDVRKMRLCGIGCDWLNRMGMWFNMV